MQEPIESQQNPSLLGIGEAAEFTGVSIDTLRRWEKKGKIKTYRSPGGHRYFQRHDLEQVFGTRYQRDETIHFKKVAPKIAVEEKQESKAVELPTREPPITTSNIKDYYQDKLSVPRYITRETISKYDYAFRNISQTSVNNLAETPVQTPPPPVSTPQPSILAPSPSPQMHTPTKINIKVNYKTVAIVAFGVFIIVDLILLILWATTPKIVSPIP